MADDEPVKRRMGGRFNAGFAAAGMIYNQVVTVLSGVLIGRVVGAADYGIANIAKNLFQIALVIAPLGLDLALQRYLAGERAADPHRRAVLLALRALTFALALIPALLLVAGLGGWLEGHVYRYPDMAWVLLVTFAALPFATDGSVTGGAYRGMRRPAPAVFATYVLMPTVRVALVGALFLLGWRLWAIVAATTGAQIAAWAYVFLRARRDFRRGDAGMSGATAGAREVLRYSWVLGIALIVTMVTKTVDVLVLGHFRPAAEVGQYVAVQLLVSFLTVFSAALGQTLGSRVAERFEADDRAGVEQLLSLNMRRISLVAAPLYAIILMWGDRIDLVLGHSFRVDWVVVALLATGQLAMAMLAFFGLSLSMTGRQALEVRVLAIGLVLTLLLCGWLVPAWGQRGAAFGTLAALIVANVLRGVVVRRAIGIRVFAFGALVPVLVAVVVAGAVRFGSAPIDTRTFLSTALGATLVLLLYAAAIWPLLKPGERAAALAALRRGKR